FRSREMNGVQQVYSRVNHVGHWTPIDLFKTLGRISAVGNDTVRPASLVELSKREHRGFETSIEKGGIRRFRIKMDVSSELLLDVLIETQIADDAQRFVWKPHHWMQIYKVGRPQVSMINVVASDFLFPNFGQKRSVQNRRVSSIKTPGKLDKSHRLPYSVFHEHFNIEVACIYG